MAGDESGAGDPFIVEVRVICDPDDCDAAREAQIQGIIATHKAAMRRELRAMLRNDPRSG
jgi:hypothetical protein